MLYLAKISGERLQDHWSSGSAHVSQRLIGELIGYPRSGVRRSSSSSVRPQFQTSSPLKPLGHSKPNFVWSLLGKGEESLYKWSRSVTYEKYDGPYLPYVCQDGRGLMTGLWDFLSKFGQTHKQEK